MLDTFPLLGSNPVARPAWGKFDADILTPLEDFHHWQRIEECTYSPIAEDLKVVLLPY